MVQTSNLQLPYIAPSQAQKHVTHNEAIRALDALVQLSLISRTLKEPPAKPKEGDRYFIPSGASAAWGGKDEQIAAWQDGAWAFFKPQDGWCAWMIAENCLAVFNQGQWTDMHTGTNPVDLVGINARADDANRLSLKSAASLFDHVGNGHQLKINKAGDQQLASILFQSGYQGRVEIGTIWNRDFSIKASIDGKDWRDIMLADNKTGAVQFPGGIAQARTGKKLCGLIFLPHGGINAVLEPAAGTAVCASISADLVSLKSKAASGIFAPGMRDSALIRIWNTSKSPVQSAWVKWDTAADQLQVSDPAHIRQWVAGDTIQTIDPVSQSIAIDISPLMQKQLGGVFPQDGVLLGTAGGDLTIACFIASPVSATNLIIFKAEDRKRFNVIGVYG
ncbi:DUF2793 domain-containing protein [Phyllobacterium myrsinacearum]|uniref:DUF2793 domain-containing protein n=1 Tax=Phyllobacterium myrsinacearum TaxID=28101 RepID=A0A839EAC6_9HYPH|nr:DUF2793 domain-containing protein [Phyllobacterium myrsinacearum]MBA8876831.1 hypothetical protein [Phyllobacterium myrsinacearum]